MNQLVFDDLTIGKRESLTVDFSEALVQRFIEMTGDNNPLHCDQECVASMGLPGRVVHGMLTTSFVSTLVGTRLPGRNARLLSVSTSWPKPLFVGSTVQLEAEVIQRSPPARTVKLELRERNQSSALVLEGTALVEVLR
jgi:acyl dehydratase